MTFEKWQKLSKEEKFLNIAAELSRVKFWLKEKNKEQVLNCLNRVFGLLDLTINLSRRQKYLKELLRFREVLADFYINKDKNMDEFTKIFKTLLMFDKFTSLVKL